MAKWKLFRKHPKEPDEAFIETGEVYDDAVAHGSDDAPSPIADYLALRQREDGWDYKVDPV